MSLHSALRAQLGVAVPAMALPEDPAEDAEPVLLFFGIVDFLQVPDTPAATPLRSMLACNVHALRDGPANICLAHLLVPCGILCSRQCCLP